MSDREWIGRTLLDLEATPGEFEAAVQKATPTELERALIEIDLMIDWDVGRQRDIRGRMAHLREQHGITRTDPS